MNKKILAGSVVALFLIVFMSAVSAENPSNSINVTVTGDVPDQVTVSLVCDGKVIKTATLNSGNSWKTTFNVCDDGNYKVVATGDSDYSFSVSGNAKNGFVVKSKQLEVLGVAGDSQLGDGNAPADDKSLDTGGNGTNNGTEDTNGTDDANGTDDTNSTEDTNSTGEVDPVLVDGVDAVVDDAPDKVVKKEKSVVKKENKTNPAKLRHTGFPLVVLVVAVFAAIFVPINRRK